MLNIKTLTVEQLAEVLRIYKETVGGNIQYLNPHRLLQDITTGTGSACYDGYRIGSRWTYHSKLYFKRDHEGNLTAGFNPNFDPSDRNGDNPRYIAALKAGKEFEDLVKNLP